MLNCTDLFCYNSIIMKPLDDQALIADLLRVSSLIGKKPLTQEEYVRHGKYKIGPFYRLFGSWCKAIKQAGLSEPSRHGSKSLKDIIHAEYSQQELDTALTTLYPAHIDALHNLKEHVCFRRYVMDAETWEALSKKLGIKKQEALKSVRHVFDKIKILYGKTPRPIYSHDYQRDSYKKLSVLISNKRTSALLASKGILYLWQLQTLSLPHVLRNNHELCNVCRWLKKSGIHVKGCDEILKSRSKYCRTIVVKGAGYEGLFYSLVGCPVRCTLDYAGLEYSVGQLPETERRVITERYFDGNTFGLIGKHLGVSFERARQIHSAAIRKLQHAKWRKHYIKRK